MSKRQLSFADKSWMPLTVVGVLAIIAMHFPTTLAESILFMIGTVSLSFGAVANWLSLEDRYKGGK